MNQITAAVNEWFVQDLDEIFITKWWMSRGIEVRYGRFRSARHAGSIFPVYDAQNSRWSCIFVAAEFCFRTRDEALQDTRRRALETTVRLEREAAAIRDTWLGEDVEDGT